MPESAAPAVQSRGSQEPFLYSPASDMGRLMEQIQRVAAHHSTVLLTGETGTGKTRLARLIHDLSPRRPEPFLVVHCGALSSNLIESEMFGHVRGAFTGADRNRIGKFAEAGRGTLLLDEIDSLTPDLQTKLLRVVEERVFEPVGSNQTLTMQARLIVASNRALDQEVAAGRFRSDLYYRLNVVGFHLPPLRERAREVIRPPAQQFLAEFTARHGGQVHGITEEAGRALEAYDWPGNIRELRNVVERAVALCAGAEIQLADLPDGIRRSAAHSEPAADCCPPLGIGFARESSQPGDNLPASPDRAPANATLAHTKEKAEVARIVEALKRQNNNRLRAAAELGISRMALYKKLHRYGLMGNLEEAG